MQFSELPRDHGDRANGRLLALIGRRPRRLICAVEDRYGELLSVVQAAPTGLWMGTVGTHVAMLGIAVRNLAEWAREDSASVVGLRDLVNVAQTGISADLANVLELARGKDGDGVASARARVLGGLAGLHNGLVRLRDLARDAVTRREIEAPAKPHVQRYSDAGYERETQ